MHRDEYMNWFPFDKEIRNIVLVQEADDDDKNRNRERPMFESVCFSGEITNEFAREKGTRIYILRNSKIDLNKILKQEISENKF